jgi:putative ABC transport system permease protein
MVKSLTVFFCVFGVASLFISMTLIMGGAQNSLNSGLQRLGADILVLPQGTQTNVETALLMGKPTNAWMPAGNLDEVKNIKGVAAASPQIYLQSLFGASCCAVSEMFLVVFDPTTDFTVTPWLKKHLGRDLAKGEAIGGTYVFMPEGMKYLTLYGYNLSFKGNLEPTGMGLDQTLFMTQETARDMSLSSYVTAVSPLVIPDKEISAILVKVAGGANPHSVAVEIQNSVPGTVAIESPNLFGTFRKQMLGLLSGFAVLTILAWIISGILISLVFTMITNGRRRDIAVLRALGFKRFYVFRSLWIEAALLGFGGALGGVSLSALGIYIFHNYISGTLGLPFLFPSFNTLLGMFALTIVVSILIVSASVFLPAFRISQQEPALAMRD